MSKTLLLVTCAAGAFSAQFAVAASAPHTTSAPAIVPVIMSPSAPRERNTTADTQAEHRRNDASASRRTDEASTLDREIGTASDGGYLYYGTDAR